MALDVVNKREAGGFDQFGVPTLRMLY